MELNIYKIDPMYIEYMHKIDNKVSIKGNKRPFIGIITMINGIDYVLPLTSQTTNKREKKDLQRETA